MGRGVSHTPSPTSPPRGRTSVPGYTDRHPKATARPRQFLFFVRMGRGVLHTPLQTFLSRERMQVAGLANNHPKETARPRQFLFFVRMGRGVSHTPSLTSPPRGRTQDMYSPPSVASGGRMRYAPTTGYINGTAKPYSLPSMICI